MTKSNRIRRLEQWVIIIYHHYCQTDKRLKENSYQVRATVAARQRFVVFLCILSAWFVGHSTWDHQTSRRVGHFYTVLFGLVEFADSSSHTYEMPYEMFRSLNHILRSRIHESKKSDLDLHSVLANIVFCG